MLWLNRFQELLEYKSKHGNCNLPCIYEENQPLANWVQTQRSQYKKSILSEERVEKLNDIGFSWTAPPPKTKNEISWNHKLEELKRYKSKHGHCIVPTTYVENQPLPRWIYKQRSQYKNSKLSQERFEKLNAIGFSWTAPSYSNVAWLKKIQELLEYKEKYGDCNVPFLYEENQPLAKWVYKQRSQYKKSVLSEERINVLNDIGFSWTAPLPKPNHNSWNDKFEQLKFYRSKHGNCNIPAIYVENQSLARWVSAQRSQYKNSKLSQECIEKLNAIGFTWKAPAPKTKNEISWNDRLDELRLYNSKH